MICALKKMIFIDVRERRSDNDVVPLLEIEAHIFETFIEIISTVNALRLTKGFQKNFSIFARV